MPIHSFHLRVKQSTLFRYLGLLFSTTLLLSACSPKSSLPQSTNMPAPTPAVVDVNLLYANPWVLVGYGSPENPTVIERGLVVTAEFTPEGQVNGFSGCNDYSGSYQAAQDGTLTISLLATTRVACLQGMGLESAYLTALQNAQSFDFSSQGSLEIKYGGKTNPYKYQAGTV
jgi:heat shock protein HslJ